MCLKKLNSPLAMSLVKSFKKDNVKNIATSKSDFNYDSNFTFYKFYKRYVEFEEIPLDSKYDWIKEFSKLLIKFKVLKTKNPKTQLKKERIMKNLMSFTKNITMFTKMIMTTLMG